MNQELINLIIGSLLHDIGKIIHRTGIIKKHSILGWEFLEEINKFKYNQDIKECIIYHHGRDLAKANLDEESLAYITYVADNISAYSDRRIELIEGEEEQKGAIFDKTSPLASVFNILNGNNQNYNYPFKMLGDINFPQNKNFSYSQGNYMSVKLKLKEQLEGIEINEDYINSILHLLEATTSFIPSSTNRSELMDISLFDHSKMTAAIASCLYYYIGNDRKRSILLKEEKDFRKENAFLLYSCDMSGIQDYIYTISGTDALKSLRARSLYLEILLENIVDELLANLKLSRCNLIYTGGGHAYLLLPNTEKVKSKVELFEEELKQWFIKEFDISLYMASAYVECNSNELAQDIGSVYERVGKSISIKKSKRYNAKDIIYLNSSSKRNNHRECTECKRTGYINKEGRCNICQSLIEISPMLVKKDIFFVVSDYEDKVLKKPSLILPFNKVLSIQHIDEVRGTSYSRIYSKNKPSMGYNFSTNLWMGDYTKKSSMYNGIKTFEEFAKEAKGIDRICVLRADVDNLGKAFMFGFKEQKEGKVIKNSIKRYETISRTATLSRQLSMFFKYYINQILESKDRNALIIYSGGDDMFIVGSWEDVISLSIDINNAFNKYTQGTLTLSAGIGIYPHNFPISRMASEVGELEAAAKNKDFDKNKVTLFRKGRVDERGKQIEEDWVLEWNQLPQLDEYKNNSGIENKIEVLRSTFNNNDTYNKAIIYKILDLIRSVKDDKINIARYAYILKRAEERNSKLDVSTFYSYIKNAKERKELEIAITIYSYETRN